MTRAVASVLAVLVVTGVVGVAGTAAAAGPGDPARMVVRLSDLPPGFALTSRRPRPNATVAKETGVGLATLRRWGRVTGLEVTLDRPVDANEPPSGPASVTSTVSTYRSVAGLRHAYAASVRRVVGDPGPPRVARPIGGRLGDAAHLWESRFTQDGLRVVLYTVLWRSPGVLAQLTVAGIAGRLTAAEALALARTQAAHIRAARAPAPPALAA